MPLLIDRASAGHRDFRSTLHYAGVSQEQINITAQGFRSAIKILTICRILSNIQLKLSTNKELKACLRSSSDWILSNFSRRGFTTAGGYLAPPLAHPRVCFSSAAVSRQLLAMALSPQDRVVTGCPPLLQSVAPNTRIDFQLKTNRDSGSLFLEAGPGPNFLIRFFRAVTAAKSLRTIQHLASRESDRTSNRSISPATKVFRNRSFAVCSSSWKEEPA